MQFDVRRMYNSTYLENSRMRFSSFDNVAPRQRAQFPRAGGAPFCQYVLKNIKYYRRQAAFDKTHKQTFAPSVLLHNGGDLSDIASFVINYQQHSMCTTQLPLLHEGSFFSTHETTNLGLT